jgi:hypothetical protein
MPTCQECDQDYTLDDGNDDDGLCHPCAHAIAGDRVSSQVSARDLTIRDLRTILSEARIRLDQYIGMCACPGMPCVTACSECDRTQELVNRMRAFMRGQ